MMQFFTKDQLLHIAEGWGLADFVLPTKKSQSIVSWPKGQDPNVAIITRSDKKSTYGKPLYQCEFQKL